MSESYPIRALAGVYGLPYDALLMASDTLAIATGRHQREQRSCETAAWEYVSRKLSSTAFGELINALRGIELKAQGR